MSEFSNDPHQEQSRDLIGYAINPVDRPVIQTQFIQILHRCLDEIGLSTELIITDPYLFNARPSSWGWYEPFLHRIFQPLYSKVKCITFLTSHQYEFAVLNRFKANARTHHCRV
ncbi:MAG: hypothetical protein RLZZ628_3446, partial [Bacteroidota bacterium]